GRRPDDQPRARADHRPSRLPGRPPVDRAARAHPAGAASQRGALRLDRRDRRRPRRIRARPPAGAGGRRRRGAAEPLALVGAVGLEPPVKYVATRAGTTDVVEISGGDGRYRVPLGRETWAVDPRLTA